MSTDLNTKEKIKGDPHFIVPLVSGDKLCYSIQGYSGVIINLIYSQNFIINALFVDSHSDEKHKTQIGKIAVIPRYSKNALIFDSVKQEVVLVSQRLHITATIVDSITVDEMGKMSVKFTRDITNYTDNHTVHVEYAKPLGTFNVSFYENHLDIIDWNMTCDGITKIHGLMGMCASINHSVRKLVYF